jgi:hypothetical protein
MLLNLIVPANKAELYLTSEAARLSLYILSDKSLIAGWRNKRSAMATQ